MKWVTLKPLFSLHIFAQISAPSASSLRDISMFCPLHSHPTVSKTKLTIFSKAEFLSLILLTPTLCVIWLEGSQLLALCLEDAFLFGRPFLLLQPPPGCPPQTATLLPPWSSVISSVSACPPRCSSVSQFSSSNIEINWFSCLSSTMGASWGERLCSFTFCVLCT